MAQALGVTRAAVSRWENGVRTPRGRHLQAYEQVLERLRREGERR
jgi:transcriptional regulator with XRE-family HTH domain